MAIYRSNVVTLEDQNLAVWSVTVAWVDPTPENTTYYELEWRIGSGATTLVSNIATSPYQVWINDPGLQPGEWLHARTRAVYRGDADSILYGAWSEYRSFQNPAPPAGPVADTRGWSGIVRRLGVANAEPVGWTGVVRQLGAVTNAIQFSTDITAISAVANVG